MANGSTLTGSLAIKKRADGTGGDLAVNGSLCVNRGGDMVNVLSLGGSSSYTHHQTEESALWQIDHPLNTRFPHIRIFVNGQEVYARILYETATDSRINISFVGSYAGYAVLTN